MLNKKYKNYEEAAQSVAERIEGYKKIKEENYETYNESLKNFLPTWQQKYCEGNCYIFLCQSLKNYLEKPISKENQQVLKLAKENFNHYCERKKNESS